MTIHFIHDHLPRLVPKSSGLLWREVSVLKLSFNQMYLLVCSSIVKKPGLGVKKYIETLVLNSPGIIKATPLKMRHHSILLSEFNFDIYFTLWS